MKKSEYKCSNCSRKSNQWIGKCPDCLEWNTFKIDNGAEELSSIESPQPASCICDKGDILYKTGIEELDRVVGGGIVPGALYLIGGEPGVGKSTLLAKLADKLSRLIDGEVLYISGEESKKQVASRIRRVGSSQSKVLITHQSNFQNVKKHIIKYSPKVLVIDSIQTLVTDEMQTLAGGVSQTREVTYELMNIAKGKGITCFIAGHITKDGGIAGPKTLEHMVDTVIYFEGDKLSQCRILRSIKNRFGSTNEIGIFEMSDKGLISVSNPSRFFLSDKIQSQLGRTTSCVTKGARVLFVEIQALVVSAAFGSAKRTVQGIEASRLGMLIAVVEKYIDISLVTKDVFINVVGGMKLLGREGDLSIIASLISSYRKAPIDSSVIFLGEVGLTGEVRSSPHIEVKLREAQQFGCSKVIAPYKDFQKYKKQFNFEIVGIRCVSELSRIVT